MYGHIGKRQFCGGIIKWRRISKPRTTLTRSLSFAIINNHVMNEIISGNSERIFSSLGSDSFMCFSMYQAKSSDITTRDAYEPTKTRARKSFLRLAKNDPIHGASVYNCQTCSYCCCLNKNGHSSEVPSWFATALTTKPTPVTATKDQPGNAYIEFVYYSNWRAATSSCTLNERAELLHS